MARELPQNGGPPKGTMNNFRTSVWANLFTEEEVRFAEQHVWNDLTAELEIVRIRIRRLLVAEARQMVHDGTMTKEELEEIVEEVYLTQTGKQYGKLLQKKKFRRADFTHQINVLLGRLESLTKLHHDLNTAAAKADAPAGEAPITTIRVEVVGAKSSEVSQLGLEKPEEPEA